MMGQVLAYFDPGAGSLLMQLLLGGIGGIAVLLRYVWQRFTWRDQLTAPPTSGEIPII